MGLGGSVFLVQLLIGRAKAPAIATTSVAKEPFVASTEARTTGWNTT